MILTFASDVATHALTFDTPLSGVDYVYVWADGIHVNIRLEEHKLCLLVMIGVRADGRKELIALADGYRESAESWADLLRDCKRRRMRAPVLAVGGRGAGVLGGAARGVPRGAGGPLLVPQDRERASGAAEKRRIPARRRRWPRSGTPRTRTTPALPRRHSTRPTARSSPRPPRRSPMTWTSCSRSATTRPGTGSSSEPPTRSNLLSPPYGTGPRSPGPRLPGRRAGHGVQADRVSTGPLAPGQRPPPRRARPGRNAIRQRQARRATRRRGTAGSSLEDLIHRS